jgi:hypothetical protein
MLKYHIQTVELSSAQNAIQFNSIPQNYDDLYVVWSTRYVSESTTKTSIFFNNSSSNFSYRLLQGDGSSAAAGSNTLALGGINNGSNTTVNTFSNNQMLVSNYTANTAKSYSVNAVNENNATTSFQDIWAGLWNNSAPITSLTLSGSSALAIGSSASLYGVRRGSDGRTEVASGGVITTSGGYTIHTFNTSGTFVPNRNLQIEYLVIAGGGGGAARNGNAGGGGGGGAGGYRSSVTGELSGGGSSAESVIVVNSGISYPVLVGAGGAGGAAGGQNAGTQGSNSRFIGITSVGGGWGNALADNGQSSGLGGSGGGLSNNKQNAAAPGAGTVGQGYAGGQSLSLTGASGGGGAGAVGDTCVSGQNTGSNGGVGVNSSITGLSIFRAGGGGGGGYGASGGQGGNGGGGAGSSNTGATSGVANTGGGGGASGSNTSGTFPGGAGGSGIVIIRYLTP